MTLIAVLVIGLASLASIELRKSSRGNHAALARANARLALMQAIGQLQKTLGPDQRVSANAEILGGSPSQPHWTGAWRSTQDDGSSFFARDDLAGGLSDARWTKKSPAKDRVIEWLVSGSGDPTAESQSDSVLMVEVDGGVKVEVPKLVVTNPTNGLAGHFAWWTGDLGVRANVGTRDPRKHVPFMPDSASNGAWYRVMASQAADSSMMEGGVTFEDDEILKLVSSESTGLTSAGGGWAKQHAFDFTVDSWGVLADVSRGGLKQDLTAYFNGSGDISSWKGLSGISGDESLVGDPRGLGSRYVKAGPRFGLLRDWARLEVPFSDGVAASMLADTDPDAGKLSEEKALANEEPVKLAGNMSTHLQPVLVEASNYTHISTFQLEGTSPPEFQLRHHHYPRVVLWNPYNVELDFDRSIIMIQGNGRQEMWTENYHYDSNGRINGVSHGQWLSFEGGRSTAFNVEGGGIMSSDGYNDPYMGAYYFSIPKTRFGAGECLVFSPARQAEYDCLSPYRPGSYNLNRNELSCEVSPDPARSYYVSGTDIGGGIPYLPVKFWFAPTPYWAANGIVNQADDTRAVLKHVGSASTVTFEDFDALPQIAVVSASLQYGAGREPRVAWNQQVKMPIQRLSQHNPRPTVTPNVRTREGIRLRWFDEHRSNQLASGALESTAHFEDALIGNWNPRASFILRSPWENIAGDLPQGGGGGGPWFFGAYTRDLYDQAVGWSDQTPVTRDGRSHGNPFGPPQEGANRHVLFDVPRSETGVISLAQFQHAKISELIWHPSYAIGNSLADPRLGEGGTDGLNRTAAVAGNSSALRLGGFHERQLGWSADAQRSAGRSDWASTARAMLGEVPETDNLVYDLSFEANQTLWDRFYLSSGSATDKGTFLKDPGANPLPNSRMRLAAWHRSVPTADDLSDFHRSAAHLMVDGAFNVNSTRVEAWKALLASPRLSGFGGDENVPFPRVLNPPGDAWKNGDASDSDEVWAGYRVLTPDEIQQLAEAIVEQVKLRGPFVSMADFVNRRLAEDETGRMGALQAAIERAGLNSTLAADFPLGNQSSLPDYAHPDHISDATLMEQTLKPASKLWGAPAWLTQADLLQSLGPVLAARSDSFVIRAYGDSTDASGNVVARVWCEAIVQRTPEALSPDESGINPLVQDGKLDFGRRFVVTSFRWLSPEEI